MISSIIKITRKPTPVVVVYSDLYIQAFMKSTKLNNFMVSVYMTILGTSTKSNSRLINILSDTLGI